MTANIERPGERRIIMRRSRGPGPRFAGNGRLDGAPRELDEIDEAIDPEDAERHVRDLSRQSQPTGEPDDLSPMQRMADVMDAGDAAYAREYRLVLLHKMIMRKMPADQIARALGVSISTVQKDRVKLKEMLRNAAKDLHIDELIGNQNGLYDEITAMSLRIASKTTGQGAVPVAMQLAGMRTALAANADRARFLQAAGVFDVLRFRKADSSEAQTDIQLLMEQTRDLLQGLRAEDANLAQNLHDDGFSAFDLSDPEPESEEL